jgi:hypothetical protein
MKPLSSCDDGEGCEEQMEDHLVANKEAIKIPAEHDIRVEKFGKDRRYPKKEQCPPGEWWKNHVLSHHGK